jgi:hypothetical protein
LVEVPARVRSTATPAIGAAREAEAGSSIPEIERTAAIVWRERSGKLVGKGTYDARLSSNAMSNEQSLDRIIPSIVLANGSVH